MPHANGLLWYVARLKPGKKHSPQRLEAQGFDPYYPQMQATVARNGRVMDRSEPVFPCYAVPAQRAGSAALARRQ